MKAWNKTVLLWVAAALISVPPCVAQRSDTHPAQNPSGDWHDFHPPENQRRPPEFHPGHAGDWLRRYESLPPAEREHALQNDPGFRRLPPETQQILIQRLRRFSSLPPEQQQRIINRMETWEHLTPGQKSEARDLFARMRQLPPQRQRMVRAAVRDLSAMPPDQRQRVIDSPRFRGMFSPEERDIMRRASQLPLAPQDARPPG